MGQIEPTQYTNLVSIDKVSQRACFRAVKL